MEYKFTANWFGSEEQIEDLKSVLPDSNSEINMLEIGSYEGRSTVWFLENLLLHKNSTITCVDPWMDYSQNEKSLITYDNKDSEWKFGTNGVEEVFRYNIESSGFSEKVIIEKGLSNVILPNLITKNKEYDIIFIDGNHVAPFVLMDSVLSWNLLKPGGILIFDDYLWMPDSYKSLTPKLAVDSFIEVFEDYVEVILDKYRKAIKKKKI
jgi:predicted O-methyltransferase YrrM